MGACPRGHTVVQPVLLTQCHVVAHHNIFSLLTYLKLSSAHSRILCETKSRPRNGELVTLALLKQCYDDVEST